MAHTRKRGFWGRALLILFLLWNLVMLFMLAVASVTGGALQATTR